MSATAERPAIGAQVRYGVAPGRIHEWQVTAHMPIIMIEITRYDERLQRDVAIHVYPDEVTEVD